MAGGVVSGSSLTEAGQSSGEKPHSTSFSDSAPVVNDLSENEKASETEGEPPARSYTRLQWLLVLAAIYSSEFLYGLDTTIVADIQGAIVYDLSEVGKLGWLAIGFPLGSVATMLVFGKAYGQFDNKWLYVSSMVMFTAASALCGATPTMDGLIIGRVWAGAGGAGMYLGVLNLISANTNIRERSFYIAISGLVWGAGCVLGPIIGGAFADSNATWRWAFYLNVVLFGLCAPVLLFMIKPYSFQPNVSFLYKIRHLDWVGVVLYAAVYTLFVVVVTFGGVQWAWNEGPIIALWVVFGVVLIAFVLSQYFTVLTTKENRLFPGDFLLNKDLILLYICQASASAALFIPVYYIPLYSQFVYGDNSMAAAVRLLPLIIIGVAANMFQGAMMPRFGYYMPWFFVAGILTTIAGALFYAAVDATTPPSYLYGFSVILAIGAGLTQQTAYSVASTKVEQNRVPEALGFINMAQIGGMVLGLTLSSAVFQNMGFRNVANALDGLGFSDAQVMNALAGHGSTVFSNASPEVRQRIVNAVSDTINLEYIFIITAGALQTITSVFLKREKLSLGAAVVAGA
ncbi:MFS general substrate transporter [Durotheca rogersii]|uniref:MFS general substrate transporter n=1 Tax=Durotheca rogersii TaxID=419775 RepID=UPI00221EF2AD|nr:MFS general substrate transporter [Durotheca rogersii]KAI5867877.1 MFS general substrate transporter [Durotheca rogersii]